MISVPDPFSSRLPHSPFFLGGKNVCVRSYDGRKHVQIESIVEPYIAAAHLYLVNYFSKGGTTEESFSFSFVVFATFSVAAVGAPGDAAGRSGAAWEGHPLRRPQNLKKDEGKRSNIRASGCLEHPNVRASERLDRGVPSSG